MSSPKTSPKISAKPARPTPVHFHKRDAVSDPSSPTAERDGFDFSFKPNSYMLRPSSPPDALMPSYLSDKSITPLAEIPVNSFDGKATGGSGRSQYVQKQIFDYVDQGDRAKTAPRILRRRSSTGLSATAPQAQSLWSIVQRSLLHLIQPASDIKNEDNGIVTAQIEDGQILSDPSYLRAIGAEPVSAPYTEASPKRRRQSVFAALNLRTREHSLTPPLTPPPLQLSQSSPIANEIVVVDSDFAALLKSKQPWVSETNDRSQRESTDERIAHEVPPLSESQAVARSYITGHAEASSNRTWRDRLASVRKWLKYYLWAQFNSLEMEKRFEVEAWTTSKPAALIIVVFLFAIWLGVCCTRMQPFTLYDKIAYVGFGILSNAFPVLWVVLDVPARFPILWQVQLFLTTWLLPCTILYEAVDCDYFSDQNNCPQKDFVGLLFTAFAFPVVSLLFLQAKRISVAIGACLFIILFAIMIASRTHKSAPDVVNYALFTVALIWASFLKDRSDRRQFILREELRSQCTNTQTAQIKQRIAAESYQAFVSYIFHEARVPLNTGMLACQNLMAEGILPAASEKNDLSIELSSSLNVMETVLNDVLDYQRINNGRMQWIHEPFRLHDCIRIVAEQHSQKATAREIDLRCTLDPAIDALLGSISSDKARVMQIVNNLLSNALKFTAPNGHVTIHTSLVFPPPLKGPAQKTGLTHFRQDIAIIRLAVEDNGQGIRRDDLVDAKLFSPYIQTELGKRSVNGKGSGLGLSLVKQSVQLAGGRLGVQSEWDKGSTFWCEILFDRLPAVPAM